MNAAARLGAYGVGLVLIFGGAVAVSGAVVPVTAVSAWTERADTEHRGSSAVGSGTNEPAAAPAEMVRGLSLQQDGYQISSVAAPTRIRTPGDLTFLITDSHGRRALTDYATSHDKQLHLIVVRSDGTHYRHVHPELRGDGLWAIPWTWDAAGSYRVFADFVPSDTAQRPTITLTRTVEVGGPYAPQSQTSPSTTSTVDGFDLALTGQLRAGTESRLTVRVTRAAEPVTALQPYLGAYGHLVALRDGDLAYLHVHPEGADPEPGERAGPTVTFMTEAPTAGRYLLFFDFQVDGKVRTAAFTVDAEPGTSAATERPPAAVDAHDGDGH